MYAKYLMEFYKVFGYKLRSSIKDGFLGYAMVIVDLTNKGFNNVLSIELLILRYYSDEC